MPLIFMNIQYGKLGKFLIEVYGHLLESNVSQFDDSKANELNI